MYVVMCRTGEPGGQDHNYWLAGCDLQFMQVLKASHVCWLMVIVMVFHLEQRRRRYFIQGHYGCCNTIALFDP